MATIIRARGCRMVLRASPAELRAQLAALVSSSTDAILTKTPAGIITSWNPAAERLYGYTAAEAIGQPVTLLIPPEQPDEFPAIMARIRRGERVEAYETVRQHKDGHRLTVSVTVSPLLDEAGRLLGASAIARDISGQKHAEAERAALVAALAHDLKTPLTSVQGHTELLLRLLERTGSVPPERLREGLTEQLGGLRRAVRLLNALVDFTRQRAGEPLALERAPCDLVALAQAVVREQQRLSERHTLLLVSETPTLVGEWDTERLERVLENLVGNAVKYSPQGGAITVRLGREDAPPTAVLSVADQGIGIPAAELARVLGSFARASNVPAGVRGSGLGLASARQLVEQHGGTLTLASTEGVGTTVTVRLPLAPILPTD